MHPKKIDLFQGWPTSSMLPVKRLKQAANAALSNKAIFETGLEYGPDEGHYPLRKNIAHWLSNFYIPAQPVTADRICITGGASQNLACVLQVFTDPAQTRMVWLVEPTYHLGFRIFEDAGFAGRLRGIPEDGDGMDVAALELALEAFERSEKLTQEGLVCACIVASVCVCPLTTNKVYKPDSLYGKIYKHVIYCVPSFANPSGTTMPRARREALVRVARRFDALVVADDVYDFLGWGTAHSESVSRPPPRLVDIDLVLDGGPQDRFGNVVSNGSFSKLIGPGCRVGWAEGTDGFIRGLSRA
jgi:DNA-binding transcriptional MocR family regulator